MQMSHAYRVEHRYKDASSVRMAPSAVRVVVFKRSCALCKTLDLNLHSAGYQSFCGPLGHGPAVLACLTVSHDAVHL